MVEHIYPASWMAEHLGCGSRKQCRDNSERFNRMEADMHNLYPALASINQARSNYQFGMIEGEVKEFGECDFERDTSDKIAEPRPIARGIAMMVWSETYSVEDRSAYPNCKSHSLRRLESSRNHHFHLGT